MGVIDRSGKYVRFCFYLIAVVLVNLVGLTLFFRLDLTENGVFSLSEASQEVVATLSEPLTINVFFTKDLKAPYNGIERYLHDLMDEYAAHANRFFNYTFYDVSAEAEGVGEEASENRTMASNYGIHPVQVQHVEKDEVKFQRVYMGLVLIHGDVIERIPRIMSTDGLEYKITTAMTKLNNKISALLRLEDKVQVKMFLSSSLRKVGPVIGLSDLAGMAENVEEVVEKLNAKSYDTLSYKLLDPSSDQGHAQEAGRYRLTSLRWPDIPKENIQAGTGAIGLVLEYREKAVVIQLLNVLRIPLFGNQYQLVDVDDLEEIIGENLESLIDINENLGYLASHGTPDVNAFSRMDPMRDRQQSMMTNFRTMLSESYTIREVDLKEETFSDRFDCLVVVHPTERFTDYELYQIDQMLMRGKSLAVFMNAFNEVEQPAQQQQYGFNRGPAFVPNRTGLEEMLEHYGVRIKSSIALDENCVRQQMSPQFGGGERTIYFAPIIESDKIDHSLDFLRNIKGIVTFKMSPLELDTDRIEEFDLQAFKLISSSEKSWEMSGNINLNPMFINPPSLDDEKQSLALAYMVEGEFPSYFKGKPIPEKETDAEDDGAGESEAEAEAEESAKKTDVDLSQIEGEAGFIEKGRPSRILVMGSSEVLKDNILDAQGENSNSMFTMNLIDALNKREDVAVMRSKVQQFNPLGDIGPGTRTFVKTFNIAGLPVLVVCFGLFVYLHRHHRKSRIQMMFQK